MSVYAGFTRSIQSGIDIVRGKIPGIMELNKFGEAVDIDTADLKVDVWDGVDGTLETGKIANYTYSTSADIDSISSSNVGDDQVIRISGIDTNWDSVEQTVTLDGQTRVALATSLIRVFRMANEGTTDIAGNVYCYVNGAITAGVPDTASTVRAIIKNSDNQTSMSMSSIPRNMKGYFQDFFASISQKKGQNSDIDIFIRPFGKVFQLKHRASILADGTSHIEGRLRNPIEIPEKSDIVIRADSSTANGAVAAGYSIICISG